MYVNVAVQHYKFIFFQERETRAEFLTFSSKKV